MNCRILLIETATDVCSAALTDGERVIAAQCITEPRRQASDLAPAIKEVLTQASITAKELAAVAVSSGPGSYTGLRVGVSTAKGICLGAGIPLIAVDTLSVLARKTAGKPEVQDALIIPMIDARRMEVYTALFGPDGKRLSDIKAVILEPDTFASEFSSHSRIIFTGDGAAKYENILPEAFRSRAVFLPSHPDAADMAVPAFAALKEKRFEDTAYFEPFYLKEFIAADPSRKIEAVLHPKNL
ncbi:MAG TPA: tRNA (adenosine(37)-N6)-threonylcarbamoyltransferase complex dimerization subunit type 1 TsaB [Candidatus Coprenecus pullistercoris]|nr:tRNA (adenosine(37)-N6)-threonylcarbamoyltransferase complex dimerization subunit type 1 TsaB [Candidatus Coprenecus pullistercoris]